MDIDTTGITLNGEPLDEVLKDHEHPVSKEVKEVHKETIKDVKIYKKPITKNGVDCNEQPGEVVHYTKEMILMEELAKHYDERFKEVIEEAKSEKPNTKKLVFGVICQKDFIQTGDITRQIEEYTGKKLPTNAVSNVFYGAWKPKNPRPISAFIEIQKGGFQQGRLYRLNPHIAKLSLDQIHELAKAKTKSSFSLRDAVIAVPELRGAADEFMKTKKPKLADKPKSKKKTAAKKTAPVTSPIPGIPQEVNVNININFGPFRVRFGIDK